MGMTALNFFNLEKQLLPHVLLFCLCRSGVAKLFERYLCAKNYIFFERAMKNIIGRFVHYIPLANILCVYSKYI